MRVQERQPAFLSPLNEDLGIKSSQFLFINNLKAGEIDAAITGNVNLCLTINKQPAIG